MMNLTTPGQGGRKAGCYEDLPVPSAAASPALLSLLVALPLSVGEFDRCRSVAGLDFVVGGDEAAEGGDAGPVGSPEASRLASALPTIESDIDRLNERELNETQPLT